MAVVPNGLHFPERAPDRTEPDPPTIGSLNSGHGPLKNVETLISAFASSSNTVPVTLSIKTGRDAIAQLSYRMGLRQEYPVTRSLALGVASVSVINMTSSYAVFANHGYKTQAYGLTRMTTLNDELVWELDPDAPRERVLS